MRKTIILVIGMTQFSCKNKGKNSQGEIFSNNVNKVAKTIIDDSNQLTFFETPKNPILPKFERFLTGSVKPKGWILDMMQNDLNKGIVGALLELYLGIKEDDLYKSNIYIDVDFFNIKTNSV